MWGGSRTVDYSDFKFLKDLELHAFRGGIMMRGPFVLIFPENDQTDTGAIKKHRYDSVVRNLGGKHIDLQTDGYRHYALMRGVNAARIFPNSTSCSDGGRLARLPTFLMVKCRLASFVFRDSRNR